jgi:hypothetical protein
LRAQLGKLPEEKRKNLAQAALQLVGTTDPQKLQQLLQSQMGNANLDQDSIKKAFEQLLGENNS